MKNLETCPLVSVIIPAYNAAAWIGRTLRSVLSQTYQNLEVLVIDDGSTDRTPDVVRAFAESDHRVRLLQQPNSGVAAARNLGIQEARGELIAPIDADDIWYPENIAKQVECFARSRDRVGLVYSWSSDIDEQDLPTGEAHTAQVEGDVYLTLLCHDFLANASASLIRRSCLQRVGGYNGQFRKQNAQGCEDWELYLRIAEQYEFRVVPEVLVGYRKIQHSMSCNYITMARSHALMLQIVQQRHPDIPAFVHKLSTSSFYIYLARQSKHQQDFHSTWFWIQQALQVDSITPLFRAELYILSVQSFFKTFIQPRFSSTEFSNPIQLKLPQWLKPKTEQKSWLSPQVDALYPPKSGLEILLHRLLPLLVLATSKMEATKQDFQRSLGYRRSL